jgi:hypothetical protein
VSPLRGFTSLRSAEALSLDSDTVEGSATLSLRLARLAHFGARFVLTSSSLGMTEELGHLIAKCKGSFAALRMTKSGCARGQDDKS